MNNKPIFSIKFKKMMGFFSKKETLSVLLILAFLILALASIFVNPQIYQRSVHEGDIALKDVYAPYDFIYSWGLDEDSTRLEQSKALNEVPYYVRLDPQIDRKIHASLEGFFNELSKEKALEISVQDKVAGLRANTDADISDRDYRTLLDYDDEEDLRKNTFQIVKNLLLRGYISREGRDVLLKSDTNQVLIFDEESGLEARRNQADLLYSDNAQEETERYVQEFFEGNRRARQAVSDLIISYLEPNLTPDEKRTGEEKALAVERVDPVYQAWEVKKNELLIEKGKRVNARHIAQLSQLRSFLREGKSRVFFMGTLLLFILLGGIGAIYLSFLYQENFLRNTKQIAIILINMFFMIVVSDFVIRLPQPSYFIPMAAMSMLLMLLVGFNAAFLSAVIMSIFVSVLTGGKVEVALVLIIGSVVGMYAVKGARRRGSILWAGLLVGLAKFLSIVCAGLINGIEADVYIKDGVWGISSGLLSGVLVMGLLPVFEYVFKVPTNISLLEMSDLNHPLLRKLALEAPGTYHHSIMVGNLAEAACESIGANGLMARVGAYYHDIGKLTKPEYYSENEMGGKSRHAGLAPSMSALIIGKHVKEGVDIAKKYKISNTIVDFIKQHHGDGLIVYFYQKALERSRDDTVLKEDSFRYQGPKPQSKETAIVLLADSVEASSRALNDPTPSSIRNLVQKVINSKFIDGQLDHCDLTLKDMHKISDSFVRVLMAVFHTRTSYPDDEKKDREEDQEQAEKARTKLNGNNKHRKQKPK